VSNSDKILGVFDPGQDFDGWRLEAEMRSGAQGAVIRATHQTTAQPAVLKVIPARGEADVRRFERERDILQRLRHDGVVSLLAAGNYRGRLPYLALEYVPGVGLGRYADERRLRLEDRSSLFLRLCEILHFVHGAAVVHCDLNPSNVLVTDEGRLKLIDLGSAFVTGTAAHGGRGIENPGSPHYMSPEQVRDEPLDERTDVYSLGAMLYELACGSTPFAQAGDPKAAAVHDQPPRPSAAVFRTGRVLRDGEVHDLYPPIAAQSRSTTPEELSRRLATGLDDIILSAVRKDRDDRFPSVRHLSDIIKEWLRG
jgi:eukaryotic-like serine/threonine-protein kinase